MKQIAKLIDKFRKQHRSIQMKVLKAAQKLSGACRKVGESWSGSFAGYHGRLYYGHFEPPPRQKAFSVAWGGIRGIPDSWRDMKPEEVKAEIERLAGGNVSLDRLEKDTKLLRNDLRELQREIAIECSSIDMEGMEKEKQLLAEIESFSFGPTHQEITAKALPKSLVSRDQEAILQGICVPAHLFYNSITQETENLSNNAETFLKLSERFVRQLMLKTKTRPVITSDRLKDLHPEINRKCHELYAKGMYGEAVEKSFKVVRDRLRNLSGYETGSEAFGKGKLHIKGAVATHVDKDFNEGVKFLTMAIDRFRNEKSHSSDAKIDDPVRAYEYLRISSLAMHLLDAAEMLP